MAVDEDELIEGVSSRSPPDLAFSANKRQFRKKLAEESAVRTPSARSARKNRSGSGVAKRVNWQIPSSTAATVTVACSTGLPWASRILSGTLSVRPG